MRAGTGSQGILIPKTGLSYDATLPLRYGDSIALTSSECSLSTFAKSGFERGSEVRERSKYTFFTLGAL